MQERAPRRVGVLGIVTSIPAARASSMRRMSAAERPQFFFPRILKWVIMAGMPERSLMAITSSTDSAMASASLRMCTS